MKLGIVSDLHLPTQGNQPWPAQVADVMVLAGDIGVGVQGVAWAKAAYQCPVVYINGNHEYYNRNIDRLDDELHEYVAGSNVHFLQNESLILGGIRFLGTTLWTDFAIFGNVGVAALIAQQGMNDFYVIGTSAGRAVKPSEIITRHQASVEWLTNKLKEPFAGPTVVVTHHLPSIRSVAPRFKEDALTPAFASNLDSLVEHSGAALWIHGHGHEFVDYMIGPTRVLANPKGYAGEEKERESKAFQWDFAVEFLD